MNFLRLLCNLFSICGLTLITALPCRGEIKPCPVGIINLENLHGKLAFSYKNNDSYKLCYIDFQKKQSFLLFAAKEISEYPTWLPNGDGLTFYSEISGDRELYSINIDGQNLTRLTFSPGIDEDPRWSPDGNLLAFSSERGHKGKQNIFLLNKTTGDILELNVGNGRNTVPKWSPNGKEIIFSSDRFWPGWDIGIIELNSQQERFLTKGILSYCRANYFTNKNAIVYSKGAGKNVDLYEYDIITGKEQLILGLTGREYDVEVLPDDKSLFFVHESTPGGNDFQIYFYDLEKKEVKQITTAVTAPNQTKNENKNKELIRYLSWTDK